VAVAVAALKPFIVGKTDVAVAVVLEACPTYPLAFQLLPTPSQLALVALAILKAIHPPWALF
jgi:hypothetical protein